MRERIAQYLSFTCSDKRWQEMTDDFKNHYLGRADHIFTLVSEEIEKVEAEVEAANPREEPEYYRGCGDACDRILGLLRSK